MKYLILIPFAILLGLAVGSWAPKRDLMKIRKELKELKKTAEKRNLGGKLSALNNIIKIPERSRRKPKTIELRVETDGAEKNTTQSGIGTNLNSNAVSTNTPASKKKTRRHHFPNPKSENYEVDLEEAKELWETRVEIARSQWQTKLDLNDAEIELFDQAIAEMNDKLYLTMQAVAEELQNTDNMSTETGLRIMNEVTATLVETYDQIGEVVPTEQRSTIESIEMQDFIDPAAFEPLIDVRDKL